MNSSLTEIYDYRFIRYGLSFLFIAFLTKFFFSKLIKRAYKRLLNVPSKLETILESKTTKFIDLSKIILILSKIYFKILNFIY